MSTSLFFSFLYGGASGGVYEGPMSRRALAPDILARSFIEAFGAWLQIMQNRREASPGEMKFIFVFLEPAVVVLLWAILASMRVIWQVLAPLLVRVWPSLYASTVSSASLISLSSCVLRLLSYLPFNDW
jgi:hypothetical protein